MSLRVIKDMSKNIAHIVEDFPAVRELVKVHKDTSDTPGAQMYVTSGGQLAWSSTMRGSLRGKAEEFVNNKSTPWTNTSTNYSGVREMGHMVDFALTRSITRGKAEYQQ